LPSSYRLQCLVCFSQRPPPKIFPLLIAHGAKRRPLWRKLFCRETSKSTMFFRGSSGNKSTLHFARRGSAGSNLKGIAFFFTYARTSPHAICRTSGRDASELPALCRTAGRDASAPTAICWSHVAVRSNLKGPPIALVLAEPGLLHCAGSLPPSGKSVLQYAGDLPPSGKASCNVRKACSRRKQHKRYRLWLTIAGS
jgi:hypothetical protein